MTRLRFVPAAADDASLSEDERRRGAAFAQSLSLRVLSRTWQMLLKGIPEVQAANRPVSAGEMVLIRIAHAADLPTLDEALKSLDDGASTPAGARSRRGLRLPAGGGNGVSAVARDARWSSAGGGQTMRLVEAEPCGCAGCVQRRSRSRPSKPVPVNVAGRHRGACRRQSRHGLQGPAEALRAAGPHRARPARRQPDRRRAEDAARRSHRQARRPGPAATGWCRCRARKAAPTLAEIEASKRETAILDAKSDPAVAAILARFPGARIIDVRIPNAPEADSDDDRPGARSGGRRRRQQLTLNKDCDDEGSSRPDGQGQGNAGQVPGHAGRDRRARSHRPVRRRTGQCDAVRQVRDASR